MCFALVLALALVLVLVFCFASTSRTHRLLLPGLKAADRDDAAVVRVVLAQAPAVVVGRVEVELLALGDSCGVS